MRDCSVVAPTGEMSQADRSLLTYRCELRRAVSTGIIESCTSTFFLLVALRAFHAGPTAKSFISAAGNSGLLLTPWVVGLTARRNLPVARVAMVCAGVGAAAALGAIPGHSVTLYVVLSFIAMAAMNVTTPLRTQIYNDNFAPHERGRLVSRTIMIRVGAISVAGLTMGRIVGPGATRFRLLLVIVALAYVNEMFVFARIPSGHLAPAAVGRLRHNLVRAWHDRLLRTTLTSWMLMGIANLMMVPLRVDYLANPRYGLNFSVGKVALLTVFVPAMARIVSSPVYGWIFDHANFFTVRMVLNAGFGASIIMFFSGTTLPMLIIGSAVFGIAQAGGDILWSLWVTKFSPPDRIADDMSVHTFTTGVRGVLAPFIAFPLAQHLAIGWMGALCALLIGCGTLVLLPELRHETARRRERYGLFSPE